MLLHRNHLIPVFVLLFSISHSLAGVNVKPYAESPVKTYRTKQFSGAKPIAIRSQIKLGKLSAQVFFETIANGKPLISMIYMTRFLNMLETNSSPDVNLGRRQAVQLLFKRMSDAKVKFDAKLTVSDFISEFNSYFEKDESVLNFDMRDLRISELIAKVIGKEVILSGEALMIIMGF